MLDQVDLEKIMVLDIETVPVAASYQELSDEMKALWDEKARKVQGQQEEEKSGEALFHKAGIFAEFGKVVCISSGIFKQINNPVDTRDKQYEFRVKSFYNEEERKLLIHFIDLLNKHFSSKKHYLCAHNGQEFDFPYLARRILINGFALPEMLDIAGKKPWETNHLMDTMQLWKFGDYKHYTSLPLLAAIFHIPTPKDDIQGSDVGRVFYEEENGLERIAEYCEKDVVATARLLMKFKGLPMLRDQDIVNAND